MNWRDLIVDHTTDKIREAKVWSNVCKASMTFGFIWVILHNGGSEWLWLAYSAPLLGHEAGTRMLNQKEKNATPTT
jgi:hypothetical protein